jgi:hypothetical protein
MVTESWAVFMEEKERTTGPPLRSPMRKREDDAGINEKGN